MANKFVIDGIVPIIPTPFHDNEEIAWESLGGMMDFAVAAGACAVCLPAYASEFYKLSEEERLRLVKEAVARAAGRIPVIAQVNSASVRQAVETARVVQEFGVEAVCSAVPRLFAVPESDLYEYFEELLGEIRVPFILQDFNPGGASVSVEWVARLHRAHPQFRYLKLEVPMMAGKARAIREATGGEVGVLEGWGGMYLLELVEAGIAGVVPGLGMADLLARVFRLAKEGKREEAYPIFAAVLPQIVYSLQNLELYHHAEKRLLAARGVLKEVEVRRAGMRLGRHDEEYIEFLNGRVLGVLDQLGMARNPAG